MTLCLTKCYLVHIDDPDVKIHLPHQVKVPIGTTHFPLTCPLSDTHVFATADVEAMTVVVENLSNGTAWMGSRHLDLASKTVLLEGDQLVLEDGEQIYVVRFQPLAQHKHLKGVAGTFNPTAKDKSEEKAGIVFNSKDKKTKCPNKKGKRCKGEWKCIENKVLIYTPPKLKSSSLIAGFGLIGTLVKATDSSKKGTKWDLAFKNICDKLHCLQQKGYKIAIFTDNLITNKLHLKLLKRKIYLLVRRLGVPIQVFMSAGSEEMKKPVLGMWSAHAKRNDGRGINTCRSFYVGCLGGRNKCCAKGIKRDPSTADRLFAVNIGVKFFTPEEYFLGTPVAAYRFPKFNPREICTFDFKQLVSLCQELIIMVGPPDSGKTWICKRYIVPAGYVHISINFAVEMLRSKCIVKKFLRDCKSVVIDGMNPTADARKTFVNIAKKRGVTVRCFAMQVSNEQLAHNRKFRELAGIKDGLKEDARIIAYESFYQKPVMAEGYAQILCVPFAPTFDDPALNNLYHMFLLPD